MRMSADDTSTITLVVSFRGEKIELQLLPHTTVRAVQEAVVASPSSGSSLAASDVTLLLKGKVLHDADRPILPLLQQTSNKHIYRIIATGKSAQEIQAMDVDFQNAKRKAPRVRDDLTPQGQQELEERQRLGRYMMNKHQQPSDDASEYGFGRIDTLPNLPNQDKAREILTQLANDPGIRACMAKHKWNVGSLAELYPDGKVGESDVCVMGLNRNKGEQILLLIRTDDLQGFRKMLSIRKVLFHELAHNEISPHNGEFFVLMRQIERECNELDWTKGSGISSDYDNTAVTYLYTGGTYRLGGKSGEEEESTTSTKRELMAQAAMERLTAEEAEIVQNCGCNARDDSSSSGRSSN